MAGPGPQACAHIRRAGPSAKGMLGHFSGLPAALPTCPSSPRPPSLWFCSPRSTRSSQGWASTEGPVGVGRDCRCRPQHEQSHCPLQPHVSKNQVLGRQPSSTARSSVPTGWGRMCMQQPSIPTRGRATESPTRGPRGMEGAQGAWPGPCQHSLPWGKHQAAFFQGGCGAKPPPTGGESSHP